MPLPTPPQPTVRAGPLMDLPTVIRKLGHDPEPLFAACGFELAQFAHPDTELPYLATSRLIDHAVAVTGCEHLGLLIGQRIGLSSFGIVGFLMRFEASVGAALATLQRHLALHDSGGSPHVVIDGELTTLGYSVNEPARTAALEQISDLSTTHAFNIMADLCGTRWSPVRIDLARRRPADPAPYETLFRKRVVFEMPRNGVVFRSALLEMPLASHEPALRDYLEGEVNRLHALRPVAYADQVIKCLRMGAYGRTMTIAQIAATLGMGEKTLHRRLRDEGTTFRDLAQEHRYQLARMMLSTTTMTMHAIATTLDYTSEAAFNRAFKRWAGMSPARWRRERSQPG